LSPVPSGYGIARAPARTITHENQSPRKAMIVRLIGFGLCTITVLATLFSAGLAAQEEMSPPQTPPARPTRLYLVPLRDSAASLEPLAAHYRGRYGISTEVLGPLEIYGGQLNIWRQQVVAEELIALMRGAYPEIADNPEAAMIGLISSFDMYAYGLTAPSVLDWRQDGRFAVISSASLGSGDFMRPLAPGLEYARLQKLVTRNVGMTYFGLPATGDPMSVLSATIGSLEDLDRMGTDLPV
jgi:hypothetical protein